MVFFSSPRLSWREDKVDVIVMENGDRITGEIKDWIPAS